MTPVVLFGATSIVGYTLARLYPGEIVPCANGYNDAPPAQGWRRVNLEDSRAVQRLLAAHPTPLVLYCHAVCDVAKCEANPEWAHAINVAALEGLLRVLPTATRVVYLSSDHVFGGDGAYTEESSPTPISVYGRTRVEAEARVRSRTNALVIRAGLAIGPSINGRSGYLDWLRYRHRRGLPITVIADELRSAVWAEDLARRVMALARSGVCGLRHVAATRAVSRPALAAYLMGSSALPATFQVSTRCRQPVPHLGHVELRSVYDDAYSQPLQSVMSSAAAGATEPVSGSWSCSPVAG